jgi:hypothetical protein
MTPGTTGETVDGMSRDKIDRIIDAMRHERYRFSPAKRVYIPKKNGKRRPLGLPSWSDKLVGEVIRLLLEAYYEPTFSNRSHGFRPRRGCHTALPTSWRACATSPSGRRALRRAGVANVAAALRYHARDPARPLATLGITLGSSSHA